MRVTKWFVLGLFGFVGCQADALVPPDATSTGEPAEQFVAAPVPKGAQAKPPFGPGPVQNPSEVTCALAELDAGLSAAWDNADPRERLAESFRKAGQVEPAKGCDRARTVAARLQKLNLSPSRRVVWQALAEAVAPWDVELRNDLLWLAIADARKALADDTLWQPAPVRPGAVPLGNPRGFGNPQRLRDFEKQQLQYSVRLWEAVLEQRADRVAAVDATNVLFAEAKAKGLILLGCIGRTYDGALADELADLDPALFLAVLPKLWGEPMTAQFCGGHAHSRWLNGKRDGVTGTLVTYAVTSGITAGHVIEVMGRYNRKLAWEHVVKLPDDANNGNSPRSGPLLFLIRLWAFDDPDAALVAAEAEPGEMLRRHLIAEVGKVWAHTRPERIGRAIENMDNDFWRNYLRELAAAELGRRKQGLPPRTTFEEVFGK